MDNSELKVLSDVAYGMFEHYLNHSLRLQGTFLSVLVEKGEDFMETFCNIVAEFTGEYPQLSEALLTSFSSVASIYDMIRNGEGVIPSKTTQMYWIIEDAPGTNPHDTEDEKAGKWLIFQPLAEIDASWQKIRDATRSGTLGISAKVSTAKENPDSRDDRKVIYVFTPDWSDEEDVMRVRNELRNLGFLDRIGYKRNLETYAGQYSAKGKKVTFYSA